MNRPPLPPFTAETVSQKARLAEDAWNTRDPAKVALAYSVDSVWRNRAEFIHGREAIDGLVRGLLRTLPNSIAQRDTVRRTMSVPIRAKAGKLGELMRFRLALVSGGGLRRGNG
jgi:hypothetical protein